MGYAELYKFAQGLEPKVSREQLKTKAIELSGCGTIRTFRDHDLNPDVCRGYFLSAQNTEHKIVQQCGTNVIVLAKKGMNRCWDRFISVKELCHVFDTDKQLTRTAAQFETVATELLGNNQEPSPQYIAEVEGVWKALGLLCPEAHRIEVLKQKTAGHIDDYGIAVQFRIPQKYIGFLSSQFYRKHIERILKEQS